jgi:hypothetical protein
MRMTRAEAAKLGITLPKATLSQKTKADASEQGQFLLRCQAYGLPVPIAEYEFCEGRKWRADYAFPDLDVLVEIDGGAWVAGRHTRGKGFEADCEKKAEAICRGWFVLCVTPQMVKDGRLFAWLKRIKDAED